MVQDVLARVKKTGEERVYPEKVFENICDDVDNPLEFIRYQDGPEDNVPVQVTQQFQPQSEVTHQQLLVDALLKERQEKQELEARIKELEANQKKTKKEKE